VPLGRLGEAADVANGIVYLASDESRFMTGAKLKLDGGISAK
jgi:NAD(P)-dependent dehydrogenase (short-subunit alcohol dehydrogenase family)